MSSRTFHAVRWVATLLFAASVAARATELPDTPFFDEIGGRKGIAALVETFASHLYSDPGVGPFFEGVDPKGTRERLEAQFCDLAGGPCKTINPDMRKTHSGMDIRPSDFNAVVFLLKLSMHERGISFETQQRLLRKIALMRHDIVNTAQ